MNSKYSFNMLYRQNSCQTSGHYSPAH